MTASEDLPAPPPMSRAAWLGGAALLLMAAFHIGFIASDDIFYLRGARGWLEHAPYVGTDHWTLRHTIVLPLALFIRVFGLHEWVMTLGSHLFYLAFIGSNAWFLRRHFGAAVAVVVTLLLLAAPGFTVVATYLIPDVPELFFMSMVFWLVVELREDPAPRPGAWLVVGLLAGLGHLNRQTSAAVVIFAFLVFCFAPGGPRRRWLPAAAAFLGVVLAEWAYITVMTGEPLYRVKLDFFHEPITRTMEVSNTGGLMFDRDGNFKVGLLFDPILNLVVSQKYPLLFWLGLPGIWMAWQQRRGAQGRVLLMLLGLAFISFLWVGYNPKLLLVKRYFMPVAWVMAVFAGWGMVQLWRVGHARWAGLGLALALLAGLGAMAVERTNPRMAERELVAWVQQHPGQVIFTDPETRGRAHHFFEFEGVSPASVETRTTPPGALFFYNAEGVDFCLRFNRCPGREADLRPGTDWPVIAVIDGPRKPLGRLIAGLGLERMLPLELRDKFFAPAGRVVIYRRP